MLTVTVMTPAPSTVHVNDAGSQVTWSATTGVSIPSIVRVKLVPTGIPARPRPWVVFTLPSSRGVIPNSRLGTGPLPSSYVEGVDVTDAINES